MEFIFEGREPENEELKTLFRLVRHSGVHLNEKLNIIMSKITDFGNAVTTALNQVSSDLTDFQSQLDSFRATINQLNDTITTLQNTPGPLDAGDQSALDQVQALAQSVQTKADALKAPTLPVIPPAPTDGTSSSGGSVAPATSGGSSPASGGSSTPAPTASSASTSSASPAK